MAWEHVWKRGLCAACGGREAGAGGSGFPGLSMIAAAWRACMPVSLMHRSRAACLASPGALRSVEAQVVHINSILLLRLHIECMLDGLPAW